MLYTELRKFSDITKYISKKILINKSYTEDKRFIRRICELYLGIFLSRNEGSGAITSQITTLGGEFTSIENSIVNILQALDSGNEIISPINTYHSYCTNWPRAKNFIDELTNLHKTRLEIDNTEVNTIIEKAVNSQENLEETIRVANEKITETAFSKIGSYFGKNTKEDKRIKEYYKRNYEKGMNNVRHILYFYLIFLIIFFLSLLVSHTDIRPPYFYLDKILNALSGITLKTTSSVLGILSVLLSGIIIITFLGAHFAGKNYYYHLFLEKENRNRLAIAGTYHLLSKLNEVNSNQSDTIVAELTKRLFEPLNTKSSDSILELPASELIKAIQSLK